MIQDRNVHRQMASSSSGLWISGCEVITEETPIHRTYQDFNSGF